MTAVDANESGNGKNCVMKKSEPGEIQKDRTIREPSQQPELTKTNREGSRRRDQRAVCVGATGFRSKGSVLIVNLSLTPNSGSFKFDEHASAT